MSDYTETFTSTTGDTVDASELETQFDDIATAIATKLDSDGSGAMTGALAMGANKITGLASPTNANDGVNFSSLAIRQIAVSTISSDHSNSSTSYGDSGLEGSITMNHSDSTLLICVSVPVTALYISSGPLASRFGTYQVYRSSGTAAGIMEAAAGRIIPSDSVANNSYTPLFMMANETPGAGTHTYKLRHKSASTGIRSTVLGTSQGVMAILECAP